MTAPTRVVRSLRLLALLIQLALPSLGMVADARLEVEALDDRIHVESADHECGQQGHPEHCALCQFLRTPVLASAADHEVWVASASARTAPAQPEIHPVRQRLLSLPRGPPLLS